MEQNDRFDRIYADTNEELLRYLTIKTGGSPETEDLLQEVYAQFYQRMIRGILPVLDPKRYLFVSAKKALSRFYWRQGRKRETEQPLPEDDIGPADETPIEEHLLLEEQRDAVWTLVQQEPPMSYRAFVLYYGCGLSQKEIAKILGQNEQAVKQRLARTRAKIRILLTDAYEANRNGKGENR